MHERLAEVLAAEILSGATPDGAFFPSSDELVREYGVSRTVARETVQALAAAGLIAVHHGKRSTVAGTEQWRLLDPLVQATIGNVSGDRSLLLDMWETRRNVEPCAVQLAIARARDRELGALVELAERSLAACAQWTPVERGQELLRHGWAFHTALAGASGNRVLSGIVRDAHRGAVVPRALEQLPAEQMRAGLEQHVAIARAMARRDGAETLHLLHAHLSWSQPFHAPPDEEGAPETAEPAPGAVA